MRRSLRKLFRFLARSLNRRLPRRLSRVLGGLALGLLLLFFLKTNPMALFGWRRAGFDLWRHGRIQMRPEKIEGIDGLRRIIAKAETFDLPQEVVERQKVTDTVGYAAIGGSA